MYSYCNSYVQQWKFSYHFICTYSVHMYKETFWPLTPLDVNQQQQVSAQLFPWLIGRPRTKRQLRHLPESERQQEKSCTPPPPRSSAAGNRATTSCVRRIRPTTSFNRSSHHHLSLCPLCRSSSSSCKHTHIHRYTYQARPSLRFHSIGSLQVSFSWLTESGPHLCLPLSTDKDESTGCMYVTFRPISPPLSLSIFPLCRQQPLLAPCIPQMHAGHLLLL